MLKDITIGQYFPADSIIHRLDSRFKIILTALYIIMVFSADSFIGIGIGAVYVIIAYKIFAYVEEFKSCNSDNFHNCINEFIFYRRRADI